MINGNGDIGFPERIRLGGARAALRAFAIVASFAAATMGLSALPATASTPGGTEIITAPTAFGTALFVGSGPFAGFSLYFLTSDYGDHFGCKSHPVSTPFGKILCTGPSNDSSAEWPAITTTGAPVAGSGVSQSLLGTVTRSFDNTTFEQVTYAGHPLYLFDRGPGQVTGEGWDEPGLPPWNGVWNLMAPSGTALPWAGTLTTTTIGGNTVLATPMMTLLGWIDFPVYSYSKDTPTHSACNTAGCPRAWPPMLTSGSPGVSGGLTASGVGTISRQQGSQVTYNGVPLYLFANEGLAPTATGPAATGNGNGISFNGGTFYLIPE